MVNRILNLCQPKDSSKKNEHYSCYVSLLVVTVVEQWNLWVGVYKKVFQNIDMSCYAVKLSIMYNNYPQINSLVLRNALETLHFSSSDLSEITRTLH